MNLTEPNDPLDQLLRESNEHIDDNGFTARIVEALPRRRHAWFRPFVISAAAFCGLLTVSFLLPVGELLNSALLFFSTPNVSSFAVLAGGLAVTGFFFWTCVTAFGMEE